MRLIDPQSRATHASVPTPHPVTGYSPPSFDSSLGLQSLSLLKNRTYALNKTWSDGILAAHEPYLVTMHRGALLLWDRRTLEPFTVSKEPYVRTMIILAENQQVPGESSSVGFFFEITFFASGLCVCGG